MTVDWINWKWAKNLIGLLKLEVGGNHCLSLFQDYFVFIYLTMFKDKGCLQDTHLCQQLNYKIPSLSGNTIPSPRNVQKYNIQKYGSGEIWRYLVWEGYQKNIQIWTDLGHSFPQEFVICKQRKVAQKNKGNLLFSWKLNGIQPKVKFLFVFVCFWSIRVKVGQLTTGGKECATSRRLWGKCQNVEWSWKNGISWGGSMRSQRGRRLGGFLITFTFHRLGRLETTPF